MKKFLPLFLIPLFAGFLTVPGNGSGITSLNSQTQSLQSFATGSAGTDFGISSASGVHTFNLPTASSLNRGLLSTSDWSTFNAKQAALSFSSPLVNAANTVSCNAASGSQPGCLAAADWTTFNNKQPAGNYITALTGDVTATGPGSVASTVTPIFNDVWVDFDPIRGNDTTGNGSMWKPWYTIQHACNSVSPSINFPAVIHIASESGNNDTGDTTTITCQPNVSIVSNYLVQINPLFTITGGSTNDGATFTNINFVGGFSWVRNDISIFGVTFNNVSNFGNIVLKQTGTGSVNFTANNSTVLNLDMKTKGSAFITGTTLLGTTTLEDTTTAAYFEIMGGYNSSAISISGGPELYLSGVQCDEPFGCAVTGTTTANGTPLIRSDSGSLPSTIAGAYTLQRASFSQWMDNTKGYAVGDVGAPTETNVLLSIKDGHFKSKQTTAPTALATVNAGTGASCAITNATDSAGTITITFGSGAFSAGAQCNVTFNKAYNVAPICNASPQNASAANDMGSNHQVYFTSSTSQFTINYGLAQNSVGAVNSWSYRCVETQ